VTLEDHLRERRRGRIAAHVELTKPGITVFVTVTAIAGYLMAALPAASSAAIAKPPGTSAPVAATT